MQAGAQCLGVDAEQGAGGAGVGEVQLGRLDQVAHQGLCPASADCEVAMRPTERNFGGHWIGFAVGRLNLPPQVELARRRRSSGDGGGGEVFLLALDLVRIMSADRRPCG